MFIVEFLPTQGVIDLQSCITPLHFLNLDVISVTTRKTQSYARNKSLLKNVSLNYLHQILLIICWHNLSNSSMLQYAGKIAHFSFTYEKVNKTYSFATIRLQQAAGDNKCSYYNCHSIQIFTCQNFQILSTDALQVKSICISKICAVILSHQHQVSRPSA